MSTLFESKKHTHRIIIIHQRDLLHKNDIIFPHDVKSTMADEWNKDIFFYKNIGWNFLQTDVKRVIQKEGKTWWGYINYLAAETQGGSEVTPPAVKMAGYVTMRFFI